MLVRKYATNSSIPVKPRFWPVITSFSDARQARPASSLTCQMRNRYER